MISMQILNEFINIFQFPVLITLAVPTQLANPFLRGAVIMLLDRSLPWAWPTASEWLVNPKEESVRFERGQESNINVSSSRKHYRVTGRSWSPWEKIQYLPEYKKNEQLLVAERKEKKRILREKVIALWNKGVPRLNEIPRNGLDHWLAPAEPPWAGFWTFFHRRASTTFRR